MMKSGENKAYLPLAKLETNNNCVHDKVVSNFNVLLITIIRHDKNKRWFVNVLCAYQYCSYIVFIYNT